MAGDGLQIVGRIRSCFPENFGIPRQAGLVPTAIAELRFTKEFSRQELVRGLEQFSHVWLLFLFHQALAEGWQPTVRPPRLGGRRRLGVFATRSPHRPNHLGLSLVRLLGIDQEGEQPVLILGGVDLLDNTPVFDIKPYLSYADTAVDPHCGCFEHKDVPVVVTFSSAAGDFCRDYQLQTGRPLARLIEEVLAADPRPASQRGRKKSFGMNLWEVNIRWQADGNRFHVVSCTVTGTAGSSTLTGNRVPR